MLIQCLAWCVWCRGWTGRLGLTRAPSKTRGDVRRLLAALGISLSPPGAGRG